MYIGMIQIPQTLPGIISAKHGVPAKRPRSDELAPFPEAKSGDKLA